MTSTTAIAIAADMSKLQALLENEDGSGLSAEMIADTMEGHGGGGERPRPTAHGGPVSHHRPALPAQSGVRRVLPGPLGGGTAAKLP